MLTPNFDMVKNLIKMASNGEVIYMKKFRLVDMDVLQVWAIIIRSHLKWWSCARSTRILYVEYCLAN